MQLYLCLLLAALLRIPGKDKAEMIKVSIEGKISFVQRTGYYMVTTETPHVEYFIVNPDAKTLDKLIKEGKPVKIDGHLTVGADQLFVEKINGKQYPPSKTKIISKSVVLK